MFWDITKEVPVGELSELKVAPERVPVWYAAFTPDGRHLLTSLGNGTIYVWRLKEWREVDK
jgi:WD40 repeat protein